MKHYTTLIVLLLLCASYNVMAERSKTIIFYGEPIAKNVYAHQGIEKELKDFSIFELNTEKINAYVKNQYFDEKHHNYKVNTLSRKSSTKSKEREKRNRWRLPNLDCVAR